MESATQFYIKGMVCNRCVSVIREGITEMGFNIEKISLGKISILNRIDAAGCIQIKNFLKQNGFELIDDKQTRIINRVKEIVNEVYSQPVKYDSKFKFSALLSESLHMNYTAISEAFSDAEGVTLEHYIIQKRLEKVKELLVYTEFTLTKIAYITGFSSINHLSRQFKELTGLAPSHFKSIRNVKKRISRPG